MIENALSTNSTDAGIASGYGKAHSSEFLVQVAESFDIQGPVVVQNFEGRGNINHTYSVHAGNRHYLLQKVNSDVFTMPHRVMNSMIASVEAQRTALERGLGDPAWEAIELVPTKAGKPFLELDDWSVWRLMVCIPNVVCFKSLSAAGGGESKLRLAKETGRGLGIYTDLTSSMDTTGVEGSLPGYRNTGLYYRQFRSILKGNRTLEEAAGLLPGDPIIKSSTEQHFVVSPSLSNEQYLARMSDPELQEYIVLVNEKEATAMSLWHALENGDIPRTLIHGDTKLENFLFSRDGHGVKSLVDLDTVMAFTWLADWGDMLRSLVNVAGETEEDLSKIVVDREVYRAVAAGFLHASKNVTAKEVSLMATAVEAITLELGMRFLTDYLRGDSYFQLSQGDSPTLNKTRALVQLRLFQQLESCRGEVEAIIKDSRIQATLR